jgi:hypothetical protein
MLRITRGTSGGLSTENLYDIAASMNVPGQGSSRMAITKDAFLGTFNANYKDYSGTATFTKKETATLDGIINKADALVSSIQTATLNGSIQLWSNNFTNFIVGRSITLILTQNGTGSQALSTTNLKYAGAVNTLSTAPNSIDVMNIYYDGTNYLAALVKGYV